MAAEVRSIEPVPLLEINTTRLIDVMLVLLIIFILTVPIQAHKGRSTSRRAALSSWRGRTRI